MSRLKDAWATRTPTLGFWMTTDSPAVGEAVAGLGYDYVCIDMQHGFADSSSVVTVMRSLVQSSSTVICRVPWNEPGIIGRVLDMGAMGVIVPMVNTVEQAERAVAACRYAPDGARSYGPVRAAQVNGPDYHATANARVACIPMIETVEALGNLDAILSVPGIDAVYVGPADLSLTMGLEPRGDHPDAAFNEALGTIVEACGRHGVIAGIHANPEIAARRVAQGFAMVTVVSDLQATTAGAAAALAAASSTDAAEGPRSIY